MGHYETVHIPFAIGAKSGFDEWCDSGYLGVFLGI